MHTFKHTYAAFLLLTGFAFLGGCKADGGEDVAPETANANAEINAAVYELMKEWYLWNDQLPTIDPNDYDSPEEVLEALRYQELDKWSYIQDAATFDQYFSGGQFTGYGMGMKVDENNDVRISFVYKDSPADKQGINRGYTIRKVNGQDAGTLLTQNKFTAALGADDAGVQTQFEMADPAGNVRQITLTKEAVTINTVLVREVKQVGNTKVGYLVFNTFIEKSNQELDEAFNYFKSQGVTELVLDLRYNGGGSLDVAEHLASLIGSAKAGTSEFVELTFNAQKQNANQPFNFKASSADLNLDRLFVITTQASASASEAVVNGLKPYMPVYLIGDDTHGKPVGMNVFKDKDNKYAIAPITFKVANKNGEAEYYNGIPADAKTLDDLTVPFGDVTEDCLEQALYYVENGAFSGELTTARRGVVTTEQVPMNGFRAEVGAF